MCTGKYLKKTKIIAIAGRRRCDRGRSCQREAMGKERQREGGKNVRLCRKSRRQKKEQKIGSKNVRYVAVEISKRFTSTARRNARPAKKVSQEGTLEREGELLAPHAVKA